MGVVTCSCLWLPGNGRPVTSLAEKPAAGSRGVAIVTGGSRGIGAAIVEALAAEGYAVAINYTSSEAAANQVAANICSHGGKAAVFRADVAKEGEVVQLFDDVQRVWPQLPLTALVNNAGVITQTNQRNLEGVNTEAFHHIFDVNVLGPLIATREFARRAEDGGGVVNISSGAAALGSGLYGMSKAALNSMQAWLVKELSQRGIRMNTVSPGRTRSDMIADWLATNPDCSFIPMGRIGEPEEIAASVVFFLSDKASYVAGANLRVSGGVAPGSFIH